MTQGLKLEFHSEPKCVASCPSHAITAKSQAKFIEPLIPGWLERNIVREILSPQDLFYSRLFTRTKKNGKIRPIIDLKSLNVLIKSPKFKMETVKKIAKGILRSLWGCTLDIWDAYFFIPINWKFHKFLAFKLGGRTLFQFLPFGLSPAPWAFSRVVTPIKKYLHKMLILLYSY